MGLAQGGAPGAERRGELTTRNQDAGTAPDAAEPILFGQFARVFSREIVAQPGAHSVMFSILFNLGPFALSGALLKPAILGFGPAYTIAALAVLATAAWSRGRGGFPPGEEAVRRAVGRIQGARCALAILGIGIVFLLNVVLQEHLKFGGWQPVVAVLAGASGAACGTVDFAVYAFWEKRSPRELLVWKRKGGNDVN